MKVKVTRDYRITTIHEVTLSEDATKMDGRLALAVEGNKDVLDVIRKITNVSDAYCVGTPPVLGIVFPTQDNG